MYTMRNVDVMEHKIHTHNDIKQQQTKQNDSTKQNSTNDTKQKQMKQ